MEFLAQLNENWTATFTLMGQTEDSNGSTAYTLSWDGFPADPNGDPPYYSASAHHFRPLKLTHFQPEWVHDKWYQGALTLQGKIGDLDFVYSGGHMDRRQNEALDYTDYSYWYDVVYGYGVYVYDNAYNLIDPSQFILRQGSLHQGQP